MPRKLIFANINKIGPVQFGRFNENRSGQIQNFVTKICKNKLEPITRLLVKKTSQKY
jgi:hypothetical protein